MEFAMFCTRVNTLLLLVVLCSSCKFIQSPMDFGPLDIAQTTSTASLDFGSILFNSPSGVLRPESPRDISLLLSFLSASSFSQVTVAARGAGHSIYGQAQAPDGIVIMMDSLPSTIEIHRRRDGEAALSYADVSGGVLWVELLAESLKVGLAPRSWTDYLYLSIGGTLSNGGISGQAFKYGPQITNVLQLDVITGKGKLVTCSPTMSSELFYAVLGGLGQFGIITSARILLQDAPHKVRWLRAFYQDFDIFTKDQELLISMPEKVDYVEGFIVLDERSLHGSSIAFPSHMDFIPDLQKGSSNVYYCIEFAVYVYEAKDSSIEQVAEEILRQMSYMPSRIYSVEVSYFDFLNRVRMEEMELRRRGVWDIPHPWLNMFVPKSGIKEFRDLLMENISPQDFEGPILIYPLLREKWSTNTSAVLPEVAADSTGGGGDDEVVYIVGVLRSATPGSCPPGCLHDLLRRNRRITEAAVGGQVGAKQYLPHHQTAMQWRQHFGRGWERFAARKARFDPLNILAPGQGIFPRISDSIPRTTTRSPLLLHSSQ
ncbi:cytokinin dehydrogenase 3-like [Phoenix dactylifera]|uniref:cytokinin dehydrogenase n=1 Tax=Phoenix dactylifera TaxID=42345 RepID=A0A8B7D5R9_PHODC|nr:cytokinin dehydrogenase 3-like [Phoenix dactylifera]